jgi:hypothetical protein
VFTRSNSQEDIMAAILDHRAVACMTMPLGPAGYPVKSRLLAFGPFELVDLAISCTSIIFPSMMRCVPRKPSWDGATWAGISTTRAQCSPYWSLWRLIIHNHLAWRRATGSR